MLQLLPNWYFGLVPQDLWPDAPCEFFCFQHNLLPLLANRSNTTELPISKKTDALVFGASGLVTDPATGIVVQPRSGVSSQKLITLANPAGAELFTSDAVPWENIVGCYSGMGTAGGVIDSPAQAPVIWPMPITIRKGGSFLVTIQNLNNAADHNIRLTFYGALVYKQHTKMTRAERAA